MNYLAGWLCMGHFCMHAYIHLDASMSMWVYGYGYVQVVLESHIYTVFLRFLCFQTALTSLRGR